MKSTAIKLSEGILSTFGLYILLSKSRGILTGLYKKKYENLR